ncbi:ABC transporter permease subunit [Granulicatella sp. zg-ZJ]|uniref:methionine ABC transporter permease n=1 Tax=unclassified Granulicatella TaxID=2630493 RepID=UPI0013BF7FCC|nr:MULTISPECIES: methionine ABC transporter permease [unclassified Granulicatella]MBS4750274.1 ABC transporter permease [Carnobacteriaceae bacterium zg-ZUI78]NEW62516.1 ABC transporter permease subunit [Granulicatella sp. zg-ZJ]NEW66587.1 ABC transporter permease subunit [Granulicatella sp. zg-84]QMI85787.1 ABC transporter permease [Carnobacteriaceae bacterium zg-84]
MDLRPVFPNIDERVFQEIIKSTSETILMTLISGGIAFVLGIALGVSLVVTRRQGILENKTLYYLLDKLVNVFRSIPFLILSMLIIPFTRLLVGTSIGIAGAIVPLTVATIPFFARQVELALLEVDYGVIEASVAMGCTPVDIIFRVYLKEGLPSLIRASSLTIISLIGLTTMAGAFGAGGLGNLAISRGYNRFQGDVMIVATLIILIIVFISQAIGSFLERRATK